MHYGKYTFSATLNHATILPKRNRLTQVVPAIGQREKLSPGDIRQTQKMYRCAGRLFLHCNSGTIGHMFSLLVARSQYISRYIHYKSVSNPTNKKKYRSGGMRHARLPIRDNRPIPYTTTPTPQPWSFYKRVKTYVCV